MKINNFSLKGASLDGIILTAVKVMTMALGLITTRLLSQYLSIFDYGTYSLIQLVVSSTVSITILGMMDGINYFFCSEKDEEKRDAYIATIYLLQFSVSLLAGCVIAFAGGQICSYLGTPEAKRLMTYAAVLPFLQNILSMTQVLMLSVGKAKVLAVRNLVISLLRLLIVILVIVFVGSVGIILFMTCMPILYSCHPRSRKRLEESGFTLDKRVIRHDPLGFHDYNCLQMNAYCVVSDSGTLPEESSFFVSAGHPFPAVCIRTSTERPEALDKGCFVLAGIDTNSLLQAVETAVALHKDGYVGIPVPDYTDENVSDKVVCIIQSYTGIVNRMVWRKE